jgi:hypothetical protein
MRRVSEVGKGIGYGLDYPGIGVRVPVDSYVVQTGSQAQPSSYTTSTAGT